MLEVKFIKVLSKDDGSFDSAYRALHHLKKPGIQWDGIADNYTL